MLTCRERSCLQCHDADEESAKDGGSDVHEARGGAADGDGGRVRLGVLGLLGVFGLLAVLGLLAVPVALLGVLGLLGVFGRLGVFGLLGLPLALLGVFGLLVVPVFVVPVLVTVPLGRRLDGLGRARL